MTTPPCVNPAHLFLGTAANNMADKASKGRTSRAGAKLTASDVRTMRQLRSEGATVAALAEMFGVDESSVSKTCLRRQWRSVA